MFKNFDLRTFLISLAIMLPIGVGGYLELIAKPMIIEHNRKLSEPVFEYKKCVSDVMEHQTYPLEDVKAACKIILLESPRPKLYPMLPHWDLGDEYVLKSGDL